MWFAVICVCCSVQETLSSLVLTIIVSESGNDDHQDDLMGRLMGDGMGRTVRKFPGMSQSMCRVRVLVPVVRDAWSAQEP